VGFVDAHTHVESRPRSAVLDPQRLRGHPRKCLGMRGLPLAKALVRTRRVERRDELRSKADIEELSGHERTLTPRLR
jgi:hypothetical protein